MCSKTSKPQYSKCKIKYFITLWSFSCLALWGKKGKIKEKNNKILASFISASHDLNREQLKPSAVTSRAQEWRSEARATLLLSLCLWWSVSHSSWPQELCPVHCSPASHGQKSCSVCLIKVHQYRSMSGLLTWTKTKDILFCSLKASWNKIK